MSVKIVLLDEIDTVLGEAADAAKRAAAVPTASVETVGEMTLYSLKIPYCATVAKIRGETVVVVKACDADTADEDLAEASNLEECVAALLRAGAVRDSENLNALERAVSKIEENLMKNNRGFTATKELIRHRKTLLLTKQRYESVVDLLERMLKEEGVDAKPLAEARRRAERILDETKSLREYVGEVRDACAAAVQAGQNRLMQTFTVIAAIFMPLQLVTGWFGMNLIMPEFSWRWAYPVVAGACAVLVVILLFVFKKKRWL